MSTTVKLEYAQGPSMPLVKKAWWNTPIFPTTQDAEIRKIVFKTSLGKKISDTPISTNKPGVVVTVRQKDCSQRPDAGKKHETLFKK
jgi:hypothetical protein